jgi:threonine dehydrogenase-like Zn-dependent dehydrogenase
MLGLAGVGTDVDWTPVWMKELSISGSFLYGTEPFEGVRRPTFDVAVDLLGRRQADLRAIQPKLFALDDHDEALQLAASKETSAAAKVSFAF